MGKLDKFNHVDLLFPSEYIRAVDLRGKDVIVTIEDIDPRHAMKGREGKKFVDIIKPIIRMKGTNKKWALNKTNAQSIAKVLGTEVTKWIGEKVTIFPTQVSAGGSMCDCIRVREVAPKSKAKQKIEPELEHDQDTGEIQESEFLKGMKNE